MAAEICRAPAQFACVPAFDVCYQNYECCSGLCAGGRCAKVSTTKCSVPGEYCRLNTDCCTGNCVSGQCTGDEKQKAPIGVKCNYNYQCASNSCDLLYGICLGSTNQCARLGNTCRNSTECCSGNCDFKYEVCVSGTEQDEPRISGAPCTYNFQCPQYCDQKTDTCI